MARTEVFQLRVSPEERHHLRVVAERARRTESEVVRSLLAQLDLASVNTGIPSPTLTVPESRACCATPWRPSYRTRPWKPWPPAWALTARPAGGDAR